MAEFVETESKTEVPPTKLVIRGREGITGFNGPPSVVPRNPDGVAPDIHVTPNDNLRVDGCTSFSFSKDGSKVACITPSAVLVKSTSDGSILCVVEGANIQAADFSPMGTFLLTWQRPAATRSADEEGNLRVTSISSNSTLVSYFQKVFRKTQWPSIQWNDAETLCARMVTNEVHILQGQNPAELLHKIISNNMTAFSLSPKTSNIATFTPESKGKPAIVRVYRHSEGSEHVPTASKSFYQAQDVNMKWSFDDAALLVHTHTDVDRTGTSYYGSTSLYLMHTDGSYDCSVPLSKQGLIHDVAWCPSARNFVVIAGTMPAQSTLYNFRAEAQFLFGEAHRNTVSWSPQGRFLCLAGFGNLAGEMDFWDRNKLKKMGSTTAHCTVEYGWSPDGRYFMTATCAPRMNIDNGFKVFKYNGEGPLVNQSVEPLYEAKWCPASEGVYPDRPQSPRRKTQGEGQETKVEAVETKPAVYRPPGSSGALSAMMRAERQAGSGPKKIKGTAEAVKPAARQPYVPGLTTAPASKPSDSSKRKEKQKKAKEESNAQITAPAPAPQPAPESKAEATEPADPAKRLKNLKKKLKQIEDLKAKIENGETLNEDQRGKLSAEAAILAEIAELEH